MPGIPPPNRKMISSAKLVSDDADSLSGGISLYCLPSTCGEVEVLLTS